MHIFRASSRVSIFLAIPALAIGLALSGCKKSALAPTDSGMTEAVQSRLAGDSALGTETIQASVKNGVATLDGTVSNDAARSLAAVDAAQIPGVRTVINNLVVQAPVAQPPAPVAAAPAPAAPKREPLPPVARKPAPAVLHKPEPKKPVQQAIVVPPPPPDQNMAAPVTRRAPPPPPPAFRNITVPSGTALAVRVTQTLDSATSQIGDQFSGSLSSSVVVDGVTVLERGTAVTGSVTDVQEAAHYKGSSLLSVQLTGINRRGDRISVTSDPYTLQGKGRGKNTAEKVGGGAAVGAILGGIFGGGKGAAIGAAAGGGVGAGANTITKGEQVQIPSESIVRFRLSSPVTLRVSTSGVSDNGPDDNPAPVLQQRTNQPPQ